MTHVEDLGVASWTAKAWMPREPLITLGFDLALHKRCAS